MKTLTDEDIIRIIREEWDKRLTRLTEKIQSTSKTTDDSIVSQGLKVTHKESGIRYTVDSVGKNDCILLTPEGEKFILDKDELEKDYEIS